MIIENTKLEGIQTDLAYLDEVTSKLGFVRWQWEYTRATYDYKIEDDGGADVYFLRFNTRSVSGKLENPDAVLRIEMVYIGKETFPHGLDYESPIPLSIRDEAENKARQLYFALKTEHLLEEVMNEEIHRIQVNDTLQEAAQLMKTHQTSLLVVMDDDKISGILTDRDLAVRGYAEKHDETLTVGKLAAPFSSLDVDRHVDEAIQIMASKKLHTMPVTKKGGLVGVVTLEALVEQQYQR